MARPRTKKKSSGSTERASWKGHLTFGLVSFAVEAFNALDRRGSDIHFHQMHANCHRRIHYEKVCPVHGVVSPNEIVSGYEYSKGKYVEIDTEELTALRTESERALKLDAFVTPETVDPLYFDGRMYYLLPAENAAQEPYSVLRTAMEREEQYGIGRVIFSGKNQIALIRPVEGVLHMAMLNYSAEIRPPESVAKRLQKPAGLSRQLKLAQSLVRDWSDENFDFSQYEDTYREDVKKLINAKVKGKEIVAPAEEEEAPKTINLMEALKKSLDQSQRPKKSRKRPA